MAKENQFFKMEMLLLLILNDEDCYGAQLASKIKEETDGFINMKVGTLYPTIYKLQANGYISSRPAEKELQKNRIGLFYHLEPKGKELFEQLLTNYIQWVGSIDKLLKRRVSK